MRSRLRFVYAQFMGAVSQSSDFYNKITKEHKEKRLSLTLNTQSIISVGSGTVCGKIEQG